MLSHNILHPSQKGGLSRLGTEDAILALKNVVESAWAEGTTAHILAFDKSKAFDSPGCLSGGYLAWRRLGTPHDVAQFFADADDGNIIYAKTPHFLLSPDTAESFSAVTGVPQGDSISGKTYIAVEDLLLSFITHSIDTPTSLSPAPIRFCLQTQVAHSAHNPLLNSWTTPTSTLAQSKALSGT